MTGRTGLIRRGLIVALAVVVGGSIVGIPREISQHEVSPQNAVVYLKAGESVEQEFRLVGSGFRFAEAQVNWKTTADAHRNPALRLYRCGTDDEPLRESNASVIANEWLSNVRIDLPSQDSAGLLEPCLRLQISAPHATEGEMRVGETLNPRGGAGAYFVNGSPVEGRSLWLVIGRRWSVAETASQIALSLTPLRAGAISLGVAIASVLALVLQVNWTFRRYTGMGVRVLRTVRLLLILVMLFGGSLIAVSVSQNLTPSDWRNTFLQGFVVAPASIALIAFPIWLSATGAIGSRSSDSRKSAGWGGGDPGIWVIAAFNVAVLSVFLLALWHRLNDAERIAQFAFVLLGVFFTLEIAATVVRRVREWWLSRPRSDSR